MPDGLQITGQWLPDQPNITSDVFYLLHRLPINKQIALDKCVMRELLLLDTQI
jgi:hypothetical protein